MIEVHRKLIDLGARAAHNLSSLESDFYIGKGSENNIDIDSQFISARHMKLVKQGSRIAAVLMGEGRSLVEYLDARGRPIQVELERNIPYTLRDEDTIKIITKPVYPEAKDTRIFVYKEVTTISDNLTNP